MEINVLEKSKNKLKIELKGGSPTFANLIKKELWKQDNIDLAAVVKRHPYMNEPELTVKTSKGTPEKTLSDTTESLVKQIKELKKQATEYIK